MIYADLDILARTIFGEARSESAKGKRAVAHVILNRVKKGGRDHSISATCLRAKQFSAWNPKDPNRQKLLTVALTDKDFRLCFRAALEAVDERDFTLGSTHYHTRTVHPAWSEGHTPALRLGSHVFFNTVK